MAERKATNKYYPPDWDPKKGSVNQYNGSHHLRDRARKLDQGVLIVRFEMPFNIWCLKCENHIGMGVRYNAEKIKVGNYYSSPIYKFRMKCRLCDNYFEIQTDPAKFEYILLSGARKQVMQPEIDDLGQVKVDDEETKKRKMTDAMFRLEKRIEDKTQALSRVPGLIELKRWRTRWDDNFTANQLVRSQYRQRRKSLEHSRAKDKLLLQKTSLKIPLLKSSPADKLLAKEMLNLAKSSRLKDELIFKKKELLTSAIVTRAQVKRETTNSLELDSYTTADGGLRIKKESNF